jgi:hypothetical protein
MKKKEKIKNTCKTQEQKETQTPQQEPAHKTQRPLHHSKGTLAFVPSRTKTLSIIINWAL